MGQPPGANLQTEIVQVKLNVRLMWDDPLCKAAQRDSTYQVECEAQLGRSMQGKSVEPVEVQVTSTWVSDFCTGPGV